MFFRIVTPFVVFAALVAGTLMILRFSPSDPGPIEGDQ